MDLTLGAVVVNCADLDTMTSFWSRALELEPGPLMDSDKFRVLRGPRVNLSLQRADSPVTARDQMHLDLYSRNQAAEVERLVGLGARVVRTHHDPSDDYVVLTDPEDNEFCICLVTGCAPPGGFQS